MSRTTDAGQLAVAWVVHNYLGGSGNGPILRLDVGDWSTDAKVATGSARRTVSVWP